MTMDFLFVKYILAKCGVIAKKMTNGYIFLTDATNEQITDDEAMELVEEYLVSAVANRLETGRLN